MAAVALTNEDLAPFAVIDDAKAQAMIDDAIATAALVAPCILEDTFTQEAAAKAIIRGAILRWNEAGTGAVQSTQTNLGAFGESQSYDTRVVRRGMFWPSEIADLQKLCRDSSAGGIFAVDTVGCLAPVHADICSINFGATYCSCGAWLAGLPLYETD